MPHPHTTFLIFLHFSYLTSNATQYFACCCSCLHVPRVIFDDVIYFENTVGLGKTTLSKEQQVALVFMKSHSYSNLMSCGDISHHIEDSHLYLPQVANLYNRRYENVLWTCRIDFQRISREQYQSRCHRKILSSPGHQHKNMT